MGDGGYLILFIFVVLIIAALVSRSRSKDKGAIAVDASPAEAVNEAVAYMVGQGFALTQKTQESATFTRPKKPNTDIGCLLLLLGIIPGLLYFGLFKGTGTTTVLATTGPARTQLMISGDALAQTTLRMWARQELGVAQVALREREPCWKCGSRTKPADVRCPSCRVWLRPQ